MNEADREWDGRLAELRRTFDEGFETAAVPAGAGHDAYLIVRLGADRLAIDIRELSGLVRQRSIVPLPVETLGLLGVIGHRGHPVPVYAVGVLLGCAPPPADPWILLSTAAAPVGVAVDALEQYVELPRTARHTHERDAGPISGSLRTGAGSVEVLSIPSLFGVGRVDRVT